MTYTGLFGAPVEALKNLLANTAAFRTFTGTETALTAAARIHAIYDPASTETWPLAIITYTEGQWSAKRDSSSTGESAFGRNSSLTLIFEKQIENDSEDPKTFVNSVGSIISGMMGVSGSSGYMLISSITLNGFSKDDQSETKTFNAVYTVEWGM